MNLNSLPVVIKRQIATAQFPVNYEHAKTAIVACVRVDEVKDWADKSAALATYAKQVKDKTMLYAAQRIRARAEARLGELLLEISDKREFKTGRWKREGIKRYARTTARDFGINPGQAKRSMMIAQIFPNKREILIDNDPPATVADLVRIAKNQIRMKAVRRSRRGPSTIAKDVPIDKEQLFGLNIGIMADDFLRIDPIKCAKSVSVHHISLLRTKVLAVVEWLDTFEQHLPKSSK